MDWQPGGAGAESQQHETGADDEIHQAGAEVKQPVAVVDGENPPFGNQDEDEADDTVAGDDGDADGGDGQQEVEQDMKERTESVAAFANENEICHGFIIAEKG